jgi:hypothetical protein
MQATGKGIEKAIVAMSTRANRQTRILVVLQCRIQSGSTDLSSFLFRAASRILALLDMFNRLAIRSRTISGVSLAWSLVFSLEGS